ncbi:MAG: VWA domain-containing protein [Candidatus Poribacteria bacterium]|nr:VWA domain-containing protein [Candidatus Poribacteria bacterium]
MLNHDNLTKWTVRAAIAIWLSIDVAIAPDAPAQTPPRPHKRLVISELPQAQVDKKIAINLGENVLEITQSMSNRTPNLMADLVFVLDASTNMIGEITEIRKRLTDVVDEFEAGLIDYKVAISTYRQVNGVPRTRTQPLTSDLAASQTELRKLRQSARNSAPGYGLDAILQVLRETNFRSEASKHLLVVTHSNLQTAWSIRKAKEKILSQIIDQCKHDDIHINVIGRSESAQIQLATETGGKFHPISDNGQIRDKSLNTDAVYKSIQKIERIFKLTAHHIGTTVRQPTDIVFMFDSSLSMDTKVDEICRGVDEMANVLDSAGVDYQFGVIRFWAESGGGQSVVLVTNPPLATNQVKRLFGLPKHGDEHLLDAVMEGVPKLKTSTNRQLVLVIITDEPTSNREEKGYTVDKTIEVCRRTGAQVNVIGASLPRIVVTQGNRNITRVREHSQRIGVLINTVPSVDFQKRVAKATNGIHYVMPDSTTIADERR